MSGTSESRSAWDSRGWRRSGRGDGRRPLVLCAAITTFHPGGELDVSSFEENLRFQDAMGLDGVLVAGTTGEREALDAEERDALIAAARDCLAEDVLIIAGARANVSTTPDAVGDAARARRAGADALLLPPPGRGLPTAELVDWFRVVTEDASLPILAYHPPSWKSDPLADDAIESLRDLPRLSGVKDSLGDARLVRLWAERRDDRFGVFVGSPSLFLDVAGEVTGGILALASVQPAEFAGFARAVGASESVDTWRVAVEPFGVRVRAGGLPVLKQIHDELGLFGGEMR